MKIANGIFINKRQEHFKFLTGATDGVTLNFIQHNDDIFMNISDNIRQLRQLITEHGVSHQ